MMASLSYAATEGLMILCDWLCIAGITAGTLALLVLVINLTCRRWLSAFQMSVLWGFVLIRMLVPFAPGSDYSIQNALIAIGDGIEYALAAFEPDRPVLHRLEPSVVARQPQVVSAVDYAPQPSSQPIKTGPADASSVYDQKLFIARCWATIAILIFAISLLRYFLFQRRVSRTQRCHDQRLLKLHDEAVQFVSLSRAPALIVTDHVAQPAVMGLVRPQILLPEDITELDDEQIRMILLHELMHIKRFDLVLHWVLLLIKSVQWWNPFFWLAAARYRSLNEQSCDQAVIGILSRSNEERRINAHRYAELLVTMAARIKRPGWRLSLPASLLGFLTGRLFKRAIARRMRAAQSCRFSQSGIHMAIILLLLTSVAYSGFTDLPTLVYTPPVRKELYSEVIASTLNDKVKPKQEEIWTTTEYSIGPAIDKVAAQENIKRSEATDRCRNALAASLGGQLLKDPTEFESRSAKPDSADILLIQGETEPENTVRVFASTESHQQITPLLEHWTATGLHELAVETRFMTLNEDLANISDHRWDTLLSSPPILLPATKTHEQIITQTGHSISANEIRNEPLAVFVSTVTPETSRELIELFQRHPRSNLLFAPKVHVYSGARGELSDLTSRIYYTGLELRNGEPPLPRTEEINEGVRLEFNPLINSDQTRLSLSCRVTFSNVDDIYTASTPFEEGRASIMLPSVKQLQMNIDSELPPGETLLLGIPPTHDRKEFLYLMITPKLITRSAK